MLPPERMTRRQAYAARRRLEKAMEDAYSSRDQVEIQSELDAVNERIEELGG